MNPREPTQDLRHADPGRRRVRLGPDTVWATVAPLREDEARRLGATHRVSTTFTPHARPGAVVEVDGVRYAVVRVSDPRAAEPAMRRRFLHLACVEQPAAD